MLAGLPEAYSEKMMLKSVVIVVLVFQPLKKVNYTLIAPSSYCTGAVYIRHLSALSSYIGAVYNYNTCDPLQCALSSYIILYQCCVYNTIYQYSRVCTKQLHILVLCICVKGVYKQLHTPFHLI